MQYMQARLFPDEPCQLSCYNHVLQDWMPYRGRVLDIGCGDNSDLAGNRWEGREIWGADFQTHPQLQHPEWFRLMNDNGVFPFDDNHFDLIASRWVLEHLRDPDFFLSEVQRTLRPGGSFVGLSINAAHYVAVISRLMGLFPHRLTQNLVWLLYRRPHHDTFPVYYRFNTGSSIRKTVKNSGLKIERLRYLANPDYFRFWQPLHELASVADWFLEQLSPGLGRLYSVVEITKPAHAAALSAKDAA